MSPASSDAGLFFCRGASRGMENPAAWLFAEVHRKLRFAIEQVFDAVPHKKDSEDTPN